MNRNVNASASNSSPDPSNKPKSPDPNFRIGAFVCMERAEGIEPSLRGLEGRRLTMNYARRNAKTRLLSHDGFSGRTNTPYPLRSDIGGENPNRQISCSSASQLHILSRSVNARYA